MGTWAPKQCALGLCQVYSTYSINHLLNEQKNIGRPIDQVPWQTLRLI